MYLLTMKNILILFITGTLFASCSKGFTCSCETTDLSDNTKVNFDSYYKERKKDATAHCKTLEAGGNVPGVSTRNCTLK
jgi:hypothetical protein